MLVKASLDVGAWWLAGSILVTGFLTTITVGRIWVLAYWRPLPGADAGEDAAVALPMGASAALAGLVAITVAAGVWPEPLMALAQDAARGLIDPSAYVLSVFPVEASQ